MNYKQKNLYDKIYTAFIKGDYGPPKIPAKSEVLKKMEEITSTDYIPLTKNEKMKDIDIDKIRKNFSNIIDDLDILFDSVEAESKDILDQLTNSLKEHNGSKRELRRIGTRAKDIEDGKLGEEYLEYNFTENFDELSNINAYRSDPINTDAGIFTIRRENENVLSLYHYIGTKLEFNVVENYSRIIENGYVGSTDAGTMLDQQDPRQLFYKITTNGPTRLVTSVSLQLTADAREIDINAVTLDVDSDISHGSIRLYYKDGFQWKDVKNNSIQDIKNDKVKFSFPKTKTTHIKLDFIKNAPDIPETNTYQYVINNLAISRGTSRKKAVLYSNPITFDKYSNEVPVVATIEASGRYQLPTNCAASLYVAQDMTISGGFLDSRGNLVDPKSPYIYEFSPTYSGKVFLSDIWNAENTVSGVELYKNVDFNWIPLQFKGEKGSKIPEKVEFDNTIKHDKLNNSIFTIDSYLLFGDNDYSGVYVSGWVNTSNPDWATLEPLVDSGVLISGVDVAALESIDWDDIEDIDGTLNPAITANVLYSGQWIGYEYNAGYPFGYVGSTGRTIRFGEYDSSINGWWRPYSDYVTPTGLSTINISGLVLAEENLPDYYFNNIPYYKIYKFGYNDVIIDNTVKLFAYQERPVIGNDKYYPVNFAWSYKSSWIDEIGVKNNVTPSGTGSTWSGYTLKITDNLRTNEEYVVDSISEIKVNGTSVVLEDSEYKDQLQYTDGTLTGIKLSNLDSTRGDLDPTTVTFDYKYQYRIRNNYLSTWTGYAIISPGATDPQVTIENNNVTDQRNIPIIKTITVENLQTGKIDTIDPDGNLFTIAFALDENTTGDQHFKVTIFCASDEDTGFCANNWVPYESDRFQESTISVTPYVKLVSKITAISMVDLSTLIYDTPMNNNNRAAIQQNSRGEKFVVVKAPSKDIFPGYYFDSINKRYYLSNNARTKNIGHWIREGTITYSGVSGWTTLGPIIYTTGSDSSGVIYKRDRSVIDNTWNQGAVLPDYPNYTGVSFYNHHSTFGHPLNIDFSPTHTYLLYSGDYDPRALYTDSRVGCGAWLAQATASDIAEYSSTGYVSVTDDNNGFLFYPTAENLPAFYSISYRKVSSIDDTNSRFLYKLELQSDEEGSLAPRVDSLKFIVNRDT
jgi:hypothetical protein